jgi:hypothetical protein
MSFQKGSKDTPDNPNRMNGRIGPIRPFQNLYLEKRPQSALRKFLNKGSTCLRQQTFLWSEVLSSILPMRRTAATEAIFSVGHRFVT